jgi:hypothetical protein
LVQESLISFDEWKLLERREENKKKIKLLFFKLLSALRLTHHSFILCRKCASVVWNGSILPSLFFFLLLCLFFCFAGYWICLCEICLSKGLDVVICRVLGQFETDCCYHHWCCEFDLLSHWRLYIIPSFTKKKGMRWWIRSRFFVQIRK